jgi:hypothetical protein
LLLCHDCRSFRFWSPSVVVAAVGSPVAAPLVRRAAYLILREQDEMK